MIEVKKFSADWCVHCPAVGRIIEGLKSKTTGVSFRSIDVDTEYEIATKYGVRSVPTVIIEKNGKEVARLTGSQSEMAYQNAINEAKK